MTFQRNQPRSLLAAVSLALIAATGPISAQVDRQIVTLAPGVYEIQHRDALDGFAGGNTTVIVGERQVLVVDAPFLPSEAREDGWYQRQCGSRVVPNTLRGHG